MTGTNHAMTGAVIAFTIKNPAVAVPAAFISHYLQDLIPHFGMSETKLFKRKFNIVLVSDFLLSIGLMVLLAVLFPAHKWLIWACMVAAACPDLAWAYYRLYIERIKKQIPHYDPLNKMHLIMEWSNESWGVLVEILWFLGAGTIILALR